MRKCGRMVKKVAVETTTVGLACLCDVCAGVGGENEERNKGVCVCGCGRYVRLLMYYSRFVCALCASFVCTTYIRVCVCARAAAHSSRDRGFGLLNWTLSLQRQERKSLKRTLALYVVRTVFLPEQKYTFVQSRASSRRRWLHYGRLGRFGK